MKDVDRIFEAIHDVYESHDGGGLYLDDNKKLLIKNQLRQLILVNKNEFISDVSGSILTASQWLRKVQGISNYEHYEEYRMELRTSIQLMEWYGDYVKIKTEKNI